MATTTFPLETLPDVVLEHVLSFISYDQISRLRRTSVKFNRICGSMLTKGFKTAEKYSLKCLKEVKTKLPRRESERRGHPLRGPSDTLEALENRVTLLNMTFMKFVDSHLCCFFPGKVIDEIYTVIRKAKQTKKKRNYCQDLQELRDISSMAMEYFEEKIVPTLKSQVLPLRWNTSPMFSPGSGLSLSYSDSPLSPPGTSLCRLPVQHPASLPSARSKVKPSAKTSKLVRDLKRQADSYKAEIESQNKKMVELDRRMDSMKEMMSQQNARLAEQEDRLADMSRRLMQNTSQFADPNSKDKTGSGRTGGCGTPRIEVPVKGGENGGSGAAGCSVVTHPNSQAVQGARHKRGRSSYTAEETRETGKRSKKEADRVTVCPRSLVHF